VSGQELAYPWATSVRVDRRGDLRVMRGLRQRALHRCNEWVSYTVTNLAAARSHSHRAAGAVGTCDASMRATPRSGGELPRRRRPRRQGDLTPVGRQRLTPALLRSLLSHTSVFFWVGRW
jgi:hypothetical protein